MLIDGSVYIEFIKHDLPNLFKEVLKRSKEDPKYTYSPIIENSSKRTIKCDLCKFEGTKMPIIDIFTRSKFRVLVQFWLIEPKLLNPRTKTWWQNDRETKLGKVNH